MLASRGEISHALFVLRRLSFLFVPPGVVGVVFAGFFVVLTFHAFGVGFFLFTGGRAGAGDVGGADFAGEVAGLNELVAVSWGS